MWVGWDGFGCVRAYYQSFAPPATIQLCEILRIAVGARWNPGLIFSLENGLGFRVAASETDSWFKVVATVTIVVRF